MRFIKETMKKKICIFISLLLVFHLVCGQTSQLRNQIIQFNEEEKNWKEAQSLCRQQNLDLMTIQNQDHVNQLIGHGGWIGLYRENQTSSWKWSRTNEPAVYFVWYSGEPNNLDVEFCTLAAPYGKWFNTPCSGKFSYICHQENLILVKENNTWEEALNLCRSLGIDPQSNKPLYDLATLMSEDDHNYARQRAQDATSDEVWTGLRFLGDSWYWMGGEAVQYQDIPSCPVFACGVLEKSNSALYGIRSCGERRNFFCYKTS